MKIRDTKLKPKGSMSSMKKALKASHDHQDLSADEAMKLANEAVNNIRQKN